jgi:hypothetical protein
MMTPAPSPQRTPFRPPNAPPRRVGPGTR